MLYLTRREGQAVMIGNAIEVRVVEVRGRSVKLGFRFPRDVPVLREEVFLEIEQENRAAAEAGQALAAELGEAWGGTDQDAASLPASERTSSS